ncbi:MAG TPA: aminopeptidase [Thermoplasmata archaeon]|nr:aminopeptidase [Thermoplasmata archaeon]
MVVQNPKRPTPPYESWIPLARQVVRTSLRLGWKDVFTIYTYPPTIPLAEALALEARRTGSDTHLTLMTDDLWFTSMHELSTRWLSTASPIEHAIAEAETAHIYLGGPADARRMREIPPEKFEANSLGGDRQHEPRRKRQVRDIDLPIGRVTPERAETYGLDYEKWSSSYHKALAVDLKEIQRDGNTLARSLRRRKKVRIDSDAGTDLRFEIKAVAPIVSDGIISAEDIRRGFVRTALPAGRVEAAVRPESVDGEVRGTDPIPFAGRAIVRPWFRIRSGRIVESGAAEHEGLLHRVLQQSKVRSARVGYVTIGLNAAAQPCMLDNSFVKDDVGIGLGPHPQLERRAVDPTVSFYETIGPVRIKFER